MNLPISDIRSLTICFVIMLAIVLFVALFPLEWVPEENWLRILIGVTLFFSYIDSKIRYLIQ